MRSQAREIVFQFIFSQLFNPSDEGLFTVLCKNLNDDDKLFASQLLEAVSKNKQKYLDKIEQYAIGYKLNRIYNADKCALILGMAELENFVDTPIPVVIDQTVNIVAKFSTENSTDFVNGILARFAEER